MDKRFPIGDFDYSGSYLPTEVSVWITEIEQFPKALSKELEQLSIADLHTPYRKNGWTVSQVVHHICDSHLNAFVRLKNTLTESNPTIKPYDEHLWAHCGDYEAISVEDALLFITVLHKKWIAVLKKMTEDDFKRTLVHPGDLRYPKTLAGLTALYAWHCNHHLAHIKLVSRKK